MNEQVFAKERINKCLSEKDNKYHCIEEILQDRIKSNPKKNYKKNIFSKKKALKFLQDMT